MKKMKILIISILVFIVYAPFSIVIRNIANKEVNNKNEIWTIHNNKIMMNSLKVKNRKIYYLMHIEYLVFLQLVISILFLII